MSTDTTPSDVTAPPLMTPPEVLEVEPGRAPIRLVGTLKLLVRKPGALVALVFVFLLLVAAAFPGLFTHYGPYATDGADKLMAPSGAHWFGTDELGRDLYTRVIYGAGRTIMGTLLSVGLAVVAGLLIGVIAGFFGGWIDALLMRVIDVALAIPALLLALTIVIALGFGTISVALAVAVSLSPGFARTTRAEVLKIKHLPYIEAARTGGAGWFRVLFRHILPNSWGPVFVLALLDLGTAVLVISALSFLGLGDPPPAPEWGGLISAGRNFLITSPWLSLIPGLFLALVVFSVNHLSHTVEESRP
jgi:peptide/nickel transport system permease protein